MQFGQVRFTPAPAEAQHDGLLGWVAFAAGDAVRVDGVALRRSRRGHYDLIYPCREDRAGRPHPIAWPVGHRARMAILSAALAAARNQGVLS